MKRFNIILIIAITFLTSLFLVACAKDGTGRRNEEIVIFWGYGDEIETQVFSTLTQDFNKLHESEGLKVSYRQKSPDSYAESLRTVLNGKNGPDVFYVNDDTVKSLSSLGFLTSLDSYIASSTEVVPSEMWDSSLNRYLYDTATTTQDGPNAHYWGAPKDVGPTVIYYNETFFKSAGITVISVAAKDLASFNAGSPDSRGKTKAEYGIEGTVKEKGYFVLDDKKVFNNQVPMSWDETVASSVQVQNNSAAADGFFTEWWFNYGWSVGGDCIQYVPKTDDVTLNGGRWEFTLMDSSKNYIVSDSYTGTYTGLVTSKQYKAGQIIDFLDKVVNPEATNKLVRSEIIAAKNEGILNELPSQREAFVEFVRLGQASSKKVDTIDGKDLYGYGVCPSPTSIGGDSGKTKAFASGKVAMLIDGRWNVPNFRKQMDSHYEWDVAPLPVYKEYDSNGDITVHGVESGQSGSVALSINAKSNKKEASWKFVEYVSGSVGQLKQSKEGFAIPSQKALALSEDFLQTDRNPKNSIVFVRAAEYQTPGDWWYLRDKQWIDPWAGILNGSVRNGTKTLTEFENSNEYKNTNAVLLDYTKKIFS
ncbi:MAG: extracellular solute-binding protein [Acholeplasmatales bacterium]|jgi:ABC-type glycerol-3-phosphate transport system substrate-binding protein|nr:extracellular solute-binding protein [Acholeplasmatales bacterium]